MARLYAVLDSESLSTTGWHTRYKITFLGTLGVTFSQPFGINNKGEVDAIGNLPAVFRKSPLSWRAKPQVSKGRFWVTWSAPKLHTFHSVSD